MSALPPFPASNWKEEDRLKAVDSYHILDTPKEEEFEDIVRMAAEACNVPVSLITLLTKDRQWFKAAVGTDLTETPLDVSFCSHAILQEDLMVVPDATQDPRFSNNPLVKGDPSIRFYAGALLKSPEGLPLGTLCVIDNKPRAITDKEAAALKVLARQVMTQLELRRTLSQLRRSVEEQKRQNEQLESLVQQRTQKLSDSVHELEAFSYSISHDMRAPLRAMIAFSDILREEYGTRLDLEGIDYLNRIGAASKRMDRLIQDVLQFSRLSGEVTSLSKIDTDKTVKEIIQSYPNLHADSVVIEIRSALAPIMGVEAYLTQCVSNLLENASKFVASGTKPRIEVWSESSEGRVKIYFRDNGIGIPEHSLKRIFEIFHRVGRGNEGTGIGLAIVRKAAEKMEGAVNVSSQEGQGSLFWLDLKAA